MTRIVLPLGEVPGCIRESLRAAMKARGVLLIRENFDLIDGEELERVLDELGRNASQSLYGLGLGETDKLEATEAALVEATAKVDDLRAQVQSYRVDLGLAAAAACKPLPAPDAVPADGHRFESDTAGRFALCKHCAGFDDEHRGRS